MDTSSTVCVTVQSTDPISTTHIGLQREGRERERTAIAGVKLLLMPLLIEHSLLHSVRDTIQRIKMRTLAA